MNCTIESRVGQRLIVTAALVMASAFTFAGAAYAQSDQNCGEAVVCTDIDPRVDPQVGPVVDQIGPNEFDLGGLFG